MKGLVRDFNLLTKARLTFSVVLSALVGFYLGVDEITFQGLSMVFLGGYLLVGASNTFNQVLERDIDRKMKRTQNRPLPQHRISSSLALWVASIMTIGGGVVLVFFFNLQSCLWGLLSVFLYVLAYTPLKRKSSISVFVGAFPGAIPTMLGWVCATDEFGSAAGFLFLIQFLWQFPHFWAIAWLSQEDYRAAGLKMNPLPTLDKSTPLLCIIYTLVLIPITLMPLSPLTFPWHIDLWSAATVFLLGLWFLIRAVEFYRAPSHEMARRFMISGVIYLPLVQLTYVLDKMMS